MLMGRWMINSFSVEKRSEIFIAETLHNLNFLFMQQNL